jgi:hypothetical protein
VEGELHQPTSNLSRVKKYVTDSDKQHMCNIATSLINFKHFERLVETFHVVVFQYITHGCTREPVIPNVVRDRKCADDTH